MFKSKIGHKLKTIAASAKKFINSQTTIKYKQNAVGAGYSIKRLEMKQATSCFKYNRTHHKFLSQELL